MYGMRLLSFVLSFVMCVCLREKFALEQQHSEWRWCVMHNGLWTIHASTAQEWRNKNEMPRNGSTLRESKLVEPENGLLVESSIERELANVPDFFTVLAK